MYKKIWEPWEAASSGFERRESDAGRVTDLGSLPAPASE